MIHGLIIIKEIKQWWSIFGKYNLISLNEGDVKSSDKIRKNLKSHDLTYHVAIGNERPKVCFPDFLSIFTIIIRKSKKNKTSKNWGETCERTQRSTYKLFRSSDLKLKIQKHIESFSNKITYYAKQEIKYIYSKLNAMFQLFIKQNSQLRVSYMYLGYILMT